MDNDKNQEEEEEEEDNDDDSDSDNDDDDAKLEAGGRRGSGFFGWITGSARKKRRREE